jgi:hypothetical protein
VANGQRMLGYLGRVMEGALPTEVAVWRDLYVQGYQLTCTINAAVMGLERSLSTIQSEIQTHASRKCGCGKTVCAA